MGAALDWIMKEYNGYVQEISGTAAVATTETPILSADADCLALVMVNVGANNVLLTLNQNDPAGTGILLVANGGVIALNVRDDLTLPTMAWVATAIGAPTSVYALRVSRRFTGS